MFKTHGQNNTRTHRIWHGMKTRCLNIRDHSYANYGGRGITISDDWMKFENFFRDMGPAPDGLTLERKNNALGYSKDNCAWVDYKAQARNRRNSLWLTIGDETLIVWDWCQRTGVKPATAYYRIKSGWDRRRAVTQPTRAVKARKHIFEDME